jgi:hypothetical protein
LFPAFLKHSSFSSPGRLASAQGIIGTEFKMKRFLLVAAMLAAAVSGAEAKCSKSALNGGWSFFPISGASGPAVTISNGAFTASGTPFTITSFGGNCRGAGTLGTGSSISPFIVTSENIKSSSSAKPNMLVISILAGPIVQNTYLFRR